MGVNKLLFVEEPNSDCLCLICQEVLEDPRETSYCQHAFCRGCIERWLENHEICPTCRTPLALSHLKPLHRIWREKLHRLRVRCEFGDDGCPAITELQRRNAHMQICDYAPIACPNKPCPHVTTRRNMKDHLESCDYRLVRCERGCQLLIAANLLGSHSCVGAIKIEMDAIEDKLRALQKDNSKLERSLKKEKEARLGLEKFTQEQADAINQLSGLYEQITNKDESGNGKRKRNISLPRIAPLHTRMSISYNESRCNHRGATSQSTNASPNRSTATTPASIGRTRDGAIWPSSQAGGGGNGGDGSDGTSANRLTLPSIR